MIAVVTGAGGLIGTEACEQFVQAGYDVVGIDCDLRSYFLALRLRRSTTSTG